MFASEELTVDKTGKRVVINVVINANGLAFSDEKITQAGSKSGESSAEIRTGQKPSFLQFLAVGCL